jgi:hypothetical protein
MYILSPNPYIIPETPLSPIHYEPPRTGCTTHPLP